MRHSLAALLLTTALAVPAAAQDAGEPGKRAPEFAMRGYINKPTKLPPRPEGLKLPAGYRVSVAASDLGNARIVAAAANGDVYVSRRTTADLLLLQDKDRDGRYEARRVVAARPNLHGIAIDGRTIFIVGARDVWSAPLNPDGTLGALKAIADDLPDAGQHPNRTVEVGPDGKLYVSVGSTCNACDESNPENATMLVMNKDGTGRRIFASGLRNTIGYDWHPATGQLWGLDQGIDWLGDDDQREELNRLEQGKRYGWPYIYAAGGRNPQDVPPNGLAMDDWDRMSVRPALTYTAHAAAMQLRFADASAFPADARGDAFATFRGSWNRSQPSGYEVVRIRFGADGAPGAIEPFLTGFLTTSPGGEAAWTGRPTGLAFAPDGTMLVTDSENGVLYRVSYAGGSLPTSITVREPAAPPPAGVIAFQRPETAARGTLTVSSSAFAANGAIPQRYTAYYDDVSPPLAWSAGPAGTEGYVVIVDDPDASLKPVTHWIAYDLPAGTTALPEGQPGAAALPMPEGARQGLTTKGNTGWAGPHPPVGDRPHRYHFQVFALNAPLGVLPGADRETVLRAMAGKVLARGELVGTYQQPRKPEKL